MEHTFLLQEGRWKASGQYFNELGDATPVEGVVQVVHQEKAWLVDSQLQLAGMGGDKIATRYLFAPQTTPQQAIPFIAQNARTGRLEGRFTLVHDAILAHFHAQEGEFNGLEAVWQQTGDSYLQRGAVYDGTRLLYSWAVRLTRVG